MSFVTIGYPWDMGPNRCSSRYYDEMRKEIIVCGYDEFHTGHEKEIHRAYNNKGRPTHIWKVDNIHEHSI